jgi:16S rRNA (adenine1518-N6/adenine1519-N6)-dimethyltransferase
MHVVLKKKFSQNFLIDKNILNKICNLIPNPNLNIIEIGPGDGRLTEYILNFNPKKLTIVEIDSDLIFLIKEKFKAYNNLSIVNLDFLNFNFNEKCELIISNLPYNISSKILVKICLLKELPKNLILMFQKEFADRLLDNKLNSLNSLVSCFYNIKKKFNVSKNCFRPIPDVDSTVLFFSKKENSLLNYHEINEFINFKRKLFSHKRKTLNYILKKLNLSNSDIDSSKRVEDLSLSLLIEIFRKINL